MSTSGIMMIWCGWYGYIFVAEGVIDELGGSRVSMSAVNATVSSAMSGLGAVVWSLIVSKGERIDMIAMSNSIIAGLVAMCGGGALIDLRYANVIGLVAAALVVIKTKLFKHFHIDDVSDACAIHGVCGAWGTLAVGLFHHESGWWTTGKTDLIITQLFGLLFLVGWAGMTGTFGLVVLRSFNMLRVSSK
eukprot:3659900-Amphidinium_carterae.1